MSQQQLLTRVVSVLEQSEIGVLTADDPILQKLRWVIATGGSEKAFHDALRVYEVQADRLDRDYLEHWVDRLSLRDLWDRLLARAG